MPFDGSNSESIETKVLRRARELITDPENHAIGTLRQIKRSEGKEWVSYCALGAIIKASADITGEQVTYHEVLPLVAKHTDEHTAHINFYGRDESAHKIAVHNNTFGHERTLEMFDGAIAESISNDMKVAA